MSVRRVPHRHRWRTSDHRCPWCTADRRLERGERPVGRQARTPVPKTPPDDGFAARMAYLRSAARAAEARATMAGRDARPEWRSTLRVDSPRSTGNPRGARGEWTLDAARLREQDAKAPVPGNATPRKRRTTGPAECADRGGLAPTLSSASTTATERSAGPEDDRERDRAAPSYHLTRPRVSRRLEAGPAKQSPFSSSQVATWKRSLRR